MARPSTLSTDLLGEGEGGGGAGATATSAAFGGGSAPGVFDDAPGPACGLGEGAPGRAAP
jgi:hypothetical protein